MHPGVEAVFNQRSANVELVQRYGLEDKYVIMSVGRLVVRKGQDRVIEAMPEILKHIPNAVYVIVGDGPDRARLEQLVRENCVADSVKFVGSIRGSDIMNEYYSMANQFIMVCRELDKGDAEGFGIVYLEAASAGVPVIAGRSGGALEAVLDGVTGLLVNPDSHTEIVESIVLLAKDQALRERLVTDGYKRAKTRFQYEVLAETFDQYMEELCASPRVKSKLVRKRARVKQDMR